MITLTPTIQRLDVVGHSLYVKGHHTIRSTEFTAEELRAIAADMDTMLAKSAIFKGPDAATPEEMAAFDREYRAFNRSRK